jgi:hypothetical protein
LITVAAYVVHCIDESLLRLVTAIRGTLDWPSLGGVDIIAELPYAPENDPQYHPEGDEPPFLSEWLNADEGRRLQQQACLTLLQRSFREFLDAAVCQHHEYPDNHPKEKGNWFKNYKRWFLKEGIDWDKAPTSSFDMEELTLARNSVQHSDATYSLLKLQTTDYHSRFPYGFFVDTFEKAMTRTFNSPRHY